jgi:hypothetical protein
MRSSRTVILLSIVYTSVALAASPLSASELKEAEQTARRFIASKSSEPTAALQLRLDPRYEHLRKERKALPEGATLRFRAAQGGGPFVVSMRKDEGRWTVDTRWWDALRRLVEGAVPQEGEPEYVAKVALWLMLEGDREKLADFVVKGSDIDALFPSDYRGTNLSHFFELVREMPFAEMRPDELVIGPNGKFVRLGDLPGEPERIFIGQYGVVDLIFRMKREDGAWKLLPAGFLKAMEVW